MSTQGFEQNEHTPSLHGLEPSRLPWELVETFLLVAKAGSFRAASQEGLALSTIRRHISALEAYLGAPVFLRGRQGLTLTDIGRQAMAQAEAASRSIAQFQRSVRRHSVATAGHVTVSFPEGLGTLWIAPRLADFYARYPKIVLDFTCSFPVHAENERENDVVVTYDEPDDPAFKCRRIGSIHNILYAAEAYAEAYGLPDTLADMKDHRVVYQSALRSDADILLDLLKAAGVSDPSGVILARTNSSMATYQLIKSGVAMGVMPTYGSVLGTGLVPVPLGGLSHRRDIWLSFKEEVSDYAPARALIDWLVEQFDPGLYPWFGREFVSPVTLEKLDASAWQGNLMGPHRP